MPLIDVVLHVWGDRLDPANVTSRLGVEPSIYQQKGEKRTSSSRREITAQTGIWTLYTSKSEDLSTHIQELVHKIGDRARQVSAIAGVEGAYVDIYIAVSADNDGGGEHKFRMTQQDIDALQKIGLPIEFTLDTVKEHLTQGIKVDNSCDFVRGFRANREIFVDRARISRNSRLGKIRATQGAVCSSLRL